MTAWLEVGLSNALVATVLALVALLVGRLVRNPKVAFVAWGLVLVKLLMPPLAALPLAQWDVALWPPAATAPTSAPAERAAQPQPDAAAPAVAEEAAPATVKIAPAARPTQSASAHALRSASPQSATTAGIGDTRAEPNGRRRWSWPSFPMFVLATWIAGSATWLLVASGRIASFQRLLGRARRADESLRAEVAAIAHRMGLKRTPEVRVAQTALPPLVWVWFGRATILLPADLIEKLSHEQRTTLIAHELAHLVRRDHWARWLELAAVCLYWWHPVAWWARRNMARAGEECCDAAVVTLLPELSHAYARTLLATAEFCCEARPVPAAASGFSRSSNLKRRMEMILSTNVSRKITWRLRLALLSLAVVALPFSLRAVSAEAPQRTSAAGVQTAAPTRLVSQKSKASEASIEERLTRLEKAVQQLTDMIQAMRAEEAENAPPMVVKTVPERGAKDVDPSLSEIKVTFSKGMQDGSWSWTQRSDDTFPEVNGEIHYLEDGRTCVLPVKLEPGKTYYLSINSARFKNFKDPAGRPAIPYPITFTTAKK